MSIKIGDIDPMAIHYGSNSIGKVYLGSALIWGGETPTTTWGSALAEAANGTGRANILFVGDSYFEGVGLGSSGRPDRFIDKLVAALRAEYGVGGSGVGYVPTRYEANPGFPGSTGTATGTYSNSENYQGRHGAQPGNGQYLEWSITGTEVDFLHATAVGTPVAIALLYRKLKRD